jgi:type I restriction-modification system DNA methylase subunit
MAVKKSELYNSLWDCCDKFRGGMDVSRYNFEAYSAVYEGDIAF